MTKQGKIFVEIKDDKQQSKTRVVFLSDWLHVTQKCTIKKVRFIITHLNIT